MYLFVYFPGVKEVKDLHHHEGVEDEGELPRNNVSFLENLLIVVVSE